MMAPDDGLQPSKMKTNFFSLCRELPDHTHARPLLFTNRD